MRYFGGKTRHAKDIVLAIEDALGPSGPREVYEPFCGGCAVTLLFALRGWRVYPSDFNGAVVSCINAAIDGHIPDISGLSWEDAKVLPDSDPRKAFMGVFCSYSGFWFKRFEANAIKGSTGTLKVLGNLLRRYNVRLSCRNYLQFSELEGKVIYCDPPYEGTENGYNNKFDWAHFRAILKQWKEQGNQVFLSGYKPPFSGTTCIWEKDQDRSFSGTTHKLTERLYKVKL